MVSTYRIIKLLQNARTREVARIKQRSDYMKQQNKRKKYVSTGPQIVFQTCRVCLQQGTIPIFSDNNSYDCPLSQYLKIICEIDVSPNDIFPKYLCKSCLDILDAAIKLRKTAKESQTKLKEVSSSYQHTNSHYNVPDIELEYTDEIPILSAQEKEATVSKPKALSSHQKKVNIKLKKKVDSKEKLKESSSEGLNLPLPCTYIVTKDREYVKYYKKVSTKETKPVFECQICKKLYKKSSLADHYTTHLPDSAIQYVCEVCGKTFKKHCTFYQHRIIHINDLPHKCNLCPYKGRYKDQLNGHIKRVHDQNKEYNFKCNLCPNRYPNSFGLRHHLRRHGEPKFKCPSCHKLFYENSALQKHNKDFHTDISTVYKCDICGNSYKRRKTLLTHQIKVHNRKKMVAGRASYLKFEKSMDM